MTTKRTAAKPKRTAKQAAPKTLPPEAYDRIPRVTLTATDESLWLTRHDAQGAPVVTIPVATKDVANCFRGMTGVGSGLLPPETLFWRQDEQGAFAGLWVPPAVRPITWGVGRQERTWPAPVPGLVFCGRGRAYTVFAAPARPTRETDPLFHAPFANVYEHGGVCHGTVQFPRATLAALPAAADLFLVSGFNGDLGGGKIRSGGNLREFWEGLMGQAEFPLAELVPAGLTIGQLISGQGRARLATNIGLLDAVLDGDDDDDAEPDPEWDYWNDEDDDPAVMDRELDDVEVPA